MCQQSLQGLCFSYATEMPWFPLPVDTSTAEQGVSAGTRSANHFHQGTYTVSVGLFWGIRAVRPSSETPVNAHWNLPLCRTPGEHRAGVKHFFTFCAGQQNCSEEGSSSTCFLTLNSPWFFFFVCAKHPFSRVRYCTFGGGSEECVQGAKHCALTGEGRSRASKCSPLAAKGREVQGQSAPRNDSFAVPSACYALPFYSQSSYRRML